MYNAASICGGKNTVVYLCKTQIEANLTNSCLLSEQGLASPPTQYRFSGRQFYRSKDPTNQQYQSTGGKDASKVKTTQKRKSIQHKIQQNKTSLVSSVASYDPGQETSWAYCKRSQAHTGQLPVEQMNLALLRHSLPFPFSQADYVPPKSEMTSACAWNKTYRTNSS